MIKVLLVTSLFVATLCSKVVIDLDSGNIDSLINANPMGFIKFYSPGCPHCQTIEPVFEESAKLVKNKGLEAVFLRIDGDKHPEVMTRFEVTEVPTILWFNNARKQLVAYNGDTEMSSYFITYIEQQLLFDTPEITFEQWKDEVTSLEAENFENEKNILVIVGDRMKDEDNFHKIANAAWNVGVKSIVCTKDPQFTEFYGLQEDRVNVPFGLLMFKVRNGRASIDRFENIIVTKEEMQVDESRPNSLVNLKLENLIRLYSKEIINIFNEENEKLIIQAIPTLVLVHNYQFGSTQYDDMLTALTGVALLYRREIFFMYGSPQTKFTQIFAESYRLHEAEMPVMCLAAPGFSDMLEKYKRVLNIEGRAPSAEEIINFIEEWKNVTLKPYVSSEPIPIIPVDENGIIKLVGDTFKNTVELPEKDLILLLCSEKLEACNKFRTIFTRVANKLKKNEKLIFAEVNPYFNEIEFVGFDQMPSLVLFSDRENKLANFKEHKGKLTTREIIKFIKENTVHAITKEESLPNEEILLREEIMNEVKAMDLEQKGIARKLYDTLTDPEQKNLFKTPEKEVLQSQRDFLEKKMDMTLQKVVKIKSTDSDKIDL
jgi:thiol-disulfide isomerase/thioredoxin